MYQLLTLVGNLGRDPELRYTPSGQAVCNYQMATSRKWTGADGQLKEETCWWRITVWGKQGETVARIAKKGMRVLVTGHLKPDERTGGPRTFTRSDGTAGASYEVEAGVVRFLSRVDGSEEGEGEGEASSSGSSAFHRNARDLGFHGVDPTGNPDDPFTGGDL